MIVTANEETQRQKDKKIADLKEKLKKEKLDPLEREAIEAEIKILELIRVY